MEKFLMGEDNFYEGGAGYPSIIWKRLEIKFRKKQFFQLKVRKTIKTKYEEKLLGIWRGSSPRQYPASYDKVFLIISKELFILIKGSFWFMSHF